jgi:uncharacterized pyridoxal phosphate-containing UPF0001 family protein
MAIPEPTDDVALQRARFASLRQLLERIRSVLASTLSAEAARDFDTLSMGMSADLDAAVMEGATIVRVGSALFGDRPAKAVSPST